MARALLPFYLLLSFAMHAQDHEAPDSLLAFVQSMESDTGTYLGILIPEQYELVWHEHREGFGYHATYMRGSGSTLQDFMNEQGNCAVRGRPHGPCALHWRGARYAVISYDPPTGLIRSARWYFERHRR